MTARDLDSQVNEGLLKALCHNLSVLVQVTNKIGLDPIFWKGPVQCVTAEVHAMSADLTHARAAARARGAPVPPDPVRNVGDVVQGAPVRRKLLGNVAGGHRAVYADHRLQGRALREGRRRRRAR